MTKTQSTTAILSSKLSVLEEIFINKKGFCTRVQESAGLTLKPLGSSPQRGTSPYTINTKFIASMKEGYNLLVTID